MSGLLEPQVKRIRIEAAPYLSVESCTRQITQLRQTVNERLTAIELDVRNVVSSCSQISSRLDGIESSIRNQTKQNCCEDVLMMLREIKQDMNSLASGSYSPT
jgi:phage terminase Nu1 subunit (DNA packaging protein)